MPSRVPRIVGLYKRAMIFFTACLVLLKCSFYYFLCSLIILFGNPLSSSSWLYISGCVLTERVLVNNEKSLTELVKSFKFKSSLKVLFTVTPFKDLSGSNWNICWKSVYLPKTCVNAWYGKLYVLYNWKVNLNFSFFSHFHGHTRSRKKVRNSPN